MTEKDAARLLANHPDWAPSDMISQMAEVALIAVEKQLPECPLGEGRIYSCPRCLDVVGGYSETNHKYFYDHHCKCGQAIDWSTIVN